MQIRVHTDHSSWILLIFGIASETIFWVLDETRAISDAVVKLHGVMVGFVRLPVHTGHPPTSRTRIDMLDQCAADAATTLIVRNKQIRSTKTILLKTP